MKLTIVWPQLHDGFLKIVIGKDWQRTRQRVSVLGRHSSPVRTFAIACHSYSILSVRSEYDVSQCNRNVCPEMLAFHVEGEYIAKRRSILVPIRHD